MMWYEIEIFVGSPLKGMMPGRRREAAYLL